jgi:hypothetical protein
MILREGKKFVLNIGAGATATRYANCIEFEHKIFRHTDVVGARIEFACRTVPVLDVIYRPTKCSHRHNGRTTDVVEVDGRTIGTGEVGVLTKGLTVLFVARAAVEGVLV